MQRVPIRLKLGATLLVPVLALVVVAGLEMVSAARERDEVHDQAELATATLGPPSLLRHIELERNAASTYLLGIEDSVALSVENKEQAWDQTDAAVEDFRAMVEGEGGFLADQYRPALDALDTLGELRQTVRDYTGERSPDNTPVAREVFEAYSAIMNDIYAANSQVVPTIGNSDLRQGAELADLSAHQSDTTARVLRVLLKAQFEGAKDGVNDPEEVADLARLLGTLRQGAETIDDKVEGPYREFADQLFATEHIRQYPEVLQEIIDTGTVDLLLVLNTSTGPEPGQFGYSVFSRQVDDQLHADADDVRTAADGRLRAYGLLGLLAIALALVTTLLVSRSLTRPLRQLTRQATEMAGIRLPDAVRGILNTPLGEDVEIPEVEPVRVKTRDEVGDVADALNTVQETALELAVEQAVLRRNIADSFVNLGRRNQNLLGRQLDFITELQSNETDPDTLASLFRLDHLATRMRRNAESLLVLAGIDPPRRWSAPVRLNDVIRAALGEVEDYQRVSVLGVEPATVVGSAAADLAHLIAEFVENALTFSPPDQKVEIRGRHLDDGYTLAIIDNGFGMAPEDIERANRRLAGGESFTVAPSKYLGHYVAGNLAARHEVAVRLEQSSGSGVTAMIHLHHHLVAGTDVDGTSDGEPLASVPLPAEGRNGKALAGSMVGMQPPLPAPEAAGYSGNEHLGGPAEVAPPLMPTLNTGPVPLQPTGLGTLGAPGPGPGIADPGPGAVAPGAPAGPVPLGTGRTASGLTKRSPRGPATAAAVPQGELLDALSRHSRNVGPGPMGLTAAPSQPRSPTQAPPPLPSRPRAGGGPVAGGPGGGPTGPGGPGLPSRPPAPAGGGYVPDAARQGPGGAYPDGPAGPGAPAAGPAAPWSTLSSLPAAGSRRPQRPRGAERPEQPARPASGPWAPLASEPTGTTTSGLARRVPGANLPPNGPFAIRRRDPAPADADAAPGPSAVVPGPAPTAPPGERPEGERHERAENVYSLLTSFTVGVQRGLDEAAAPPPRDTPEGGARRS